MTPNEVSNYWIKYTSLNEDVLKANNLTVILDFEEDPEK